jgi:hypothetical protein
MQINSTRRSVPIIRILSVSFIRHHVLFTIASLISIFVRCYSTIHNPAFIIQSYGAVFAPLPSGAETQGNLSRALSSVVGVACLRAEGGVGPQLVSHVFGLLKARNVADQSSEDAWLSSDEGAEWVIHTVDKIADAVIPAQDVQPAQCKVKL